MVKHLPSSPFCTTGGKRPQQSFQEIRKSWKCTIFPQFPYWKMLPWITNNHRIFFYISLNMDSTSFQISLASKGQNLIWPNLMVSLEIFYVFRETNENQILEAGRGEKNPVFSLSLCHSFLIKQLKGPPGLNIPGSEGKTPTKKCCLEGGIWPTDISWSSYRKEPVWASQVTSRQLRHRCRKNIELWGIIRFIFFNK